MEGLKRCAEFITFLVVPFCLVSENACQGIVYFIILLSVFLLVDAEPMAWVREARNDVPE